MWTETNQNEGKVNENDDRDTKMWKIYKFCLFHGLALITHQLRLILGIASEHDQCYLHIAYNNLKQLGMRYFLLAV